MTRFFILCTYLLCTHFSSAQLNPTWKWIAADFVYDNGIKAGQSLGFDHFEAFQIDRDGNAYFVSRNDIKVYNGNSLTLLPKLTNNTDKFLRNINSFYIDYEGTYWIGTDNGLLVVNDSVTFYQDVEDRFPFDGVLDITQSANGEIWMSGIRKVGNLWVGAGLAKANKDSVVFYEREEYGLKSSLMRDLTADDQGGVWMVVGNHRSGIGYFKDGKYTHYQESDNSLPSNNVGGIHFENGILYASMEERVYKFLDGKWEDLVLNEIKSYVSDFAIEGDYLWMATQGQGVARYNQKSGELYFFNTSNSMIGSDYVVNVEVDRNGNKWFASGCYDKAFDPLALLFGAPSETPTNYAGAFMYKEPQLVYPEFYGEALTKLEGKFVSSKHFKEMLPYKDMVAIADLTKILFYKDGKIVDEINPKGAINDIFVTKDNVLYMATMKGVFYYKDGKVNEINIDGHPITKLINTVYVTDAGKVWIGHSKGVSCYENNTWTTYNKKSHELASNYVWAVLEDQKGNVWIGSQKGLNRITPDGYWEIYDKKTGHLPSNRVNCLTQDKNGNLLIGSVAGLIIHKDGEFKHYAPKDNKWITVNSIVTNDDGSLYIPSETKGFYKFTNGEWKNFSKDNSFLAFEQVYSIVEYNGKLLIANKIKEVYTPSSTSISSSNAPAPQPTLEQIIEKRLKEFSPESALYVIRIPQ